MKSNKKLIIGFSIVTAVLVIAVVSLTAVLAAFTTVAQSGFEISYSATNVNAQITAEWAKVKNDAIASAQLTALKVTGSEETTLVFNNDDTSAEVTKSFVTPSKSETTLGRDEVIVIHYSIKAVGALTLNTSNCPAANANSTEGSDTDNYYIIYTTGSATGGAYTLGEKTMNANETLDLYVVVGVENYTMEGGIPTTLTFQFNMAA